MPDVKWGYGYNHFRMPGMSGTGPLVRKENHERAMKVLSVCGFKGVELQARSGTLGTPEAIQLRFGSPKGFVNFLRSCGMDAVSSYLMTGGGRPMGGGPPGGAGAGANPVEAARPLAQFLSEVGGSCIVQAAMGSYWREAPITDEKIKTAGANFNAIGKMTKGYGIQMVLHIDFLSGIHGMEAIGKLLDSTDPDLVGLALDTAELTIAGVNPLTLYEKYPNRVKHFHFKQACKTDSASEYQQQNADDRMLMGLGKPEIERWFWELETPGGLVDFPALMKSIKRHNYSGWIIVESDRSPAPVESVMRNSWYVQHVLAKA